MTETSPLATVGGLKAAIATMPEEQQLKVVEKAGRPHILVDMRIVDDNGKEVKHDAKTSGKLQVKGHMVLQKYYKVGDMLSAADSCPLPGDHTVQTSKTGYQVACRVLPVRRRLASEDFALTSCEV